MWKLFAAHYLQDIWRNKIPKMIPRLLLQIVEEKVGKGKDQQAVMEKF